MPGVLGVLGVPGVSDVPGMLGVCMCVCVSAYVCVGLWRQSFFKTRKTGRPVTVVGIYSSKPTYTPSPNFNVGPCMGTPLFFFGVPFFDYKMK